MTKLKKLIKQPLKPLRSTEMNKRAIIKFYEFHYSKSLVWSLIASFRNRMFRQDIFLNQF